MKICFNVDNIKQEDVLSMLAISVTLNTLGVNIISINGYDYDLEVIRRQDRRMK